MTTKPGSTKDDIVAGAELMNCLTEEAFNRIGDTLFELERTDRVIGLGEKLEKILTSLIELDKCNTELVDLAQNFEGGSDNDGLISEIRDALKREFPVDEFRPGKGAIAGKGYELTSIYRLKQRLSYHRTAARKLRSQVQNAGVRPLY